MSNNAIRAKFEELKTLAFGDMDDTYDPVQDSNGDPAPFLHPIRMLIIQNNTDVALVYSFDGITDQLYLPSFAQVIFDFTSNLTTTGGAFMIAQGTQLYVRYDVGEPALSGNTTVAAVYGEH